MFQTGQESSSSYAEILELASQKEVLQIIECPVCKEVPFPPIYNCRMGHIVCCECKPKLKLCALCKDEFSDGRNFAVESIVLSSKHSCKFKENGCQVIVTGDLVIDHIQKCQFRDLRAVCHLGRHTKCAFYNQYLPLLKYLDHLKEGHMMLPTITNTKPPSIIFESHVLADTKDTFWLGDYVVYDSKPFIVRQFMKESVVYLSLAIIGDDQTAGKYATKIKINSVTEKNMNVSWTIPVHSISKSEEEIKDKFCGALPFSFIKAHSKVSTTSAQSKKRKMTFSVKYTIYDRFRETRNIAKLM